MTEELSDDSSTAGVTTLCRSCLGDADDAELRALRAPNRSAPAAGCVGTSVPLFFVSNGRTFSDSSIILCTAYLESVPKHTQTQLVTLSRLLRASAVLSASVSRSAGILTYYVASRTVVYVTQASEASRQVLGRRPKSTLK